MNESRKNSRSFCSLQQDGEGRSMKRSWFVKDMITVIENRMKMQVMTMIQCASSLKHLMEVGPIKNEKLNG